MADATTQRSNGRRDFFKSLLGRPSESEKAEAAEIEVLAQRAGIMALKFAKNEAKLSKIGVKSPQKMELPKFEVEIQGIDAAGETVTLNLIVDTTMGLVTPKPSPETPEENSALEQ